MSGGHANHRRPASGFSLAELLTVIAVGAVLSAIALPNLVYLSFEYQLARAANQLAFEISRARMKAVGENTYCRLRLGSSPDGQVTYWLERSENGLAFQPDGPAITLPASVTLESTSEVLPQFDRQGLAAAPSAIVLANPLGQKKTVTASAVGRVVVK